MFLFDVFIHFCKKGDCMYKIKNCAFQLQSTLLSLLHRPIIIYLTNDFNLTTVHIKFWIVLLFTPFSMHALLDSGQWTPGHVIVNHAPNQILYLVLRLKMWSDEVWSTHLVSTCSNVYPLYVYDNLVLTEWPNLDLRDVKGVWTFYLWTVYNLFNLHPSNLMRATCWNNQYFMMSYDQV